MKYQINVNVDFQIDIEADSEEEAGDIYCNMGWIDILKSWYDVYEQIEFINKIEK